VTLRGTGESPDSTRAAIPVTIGAEKEVPYKGWGPRVAICETVATACCGSSDPGASMKRPAGTVSYCEYRGCLPVPRSKAPTAMTLASVARTRVNRQDPPGRHAGLRLQIGSGTFLVRRPQHEPDGDSHMRAKTLFVCCKCALNVVTVAVPQPMSVSVVAPYGLPLNVELMQLVGHGF